MKQYVLALTVVSLVLTVLETRSCVPKNKTDKCVAYTGIFLHHLGQLFVFVTPFTKFFHNSPDYVLYLFLSVFVWLFIQNTQLKLHETQTCVLSLYTNSKCNVPAETPLKDPMYYMGMKNDMLFYNKLHAIAVVSYILYIGLLIIRRRSYKTATIKNK